ncbi:MAG: carboxymuconolactone decarboxylase family protein [Carnobacterium sp.]|uniref:carboxymuconolactone decarboxylase family protein n=1 Tax=Carnobacterium sp. TMP28 TaxID=3397060 RepID=UPI001D646A66|nr:carboxymuconolactone decarboxylase family protein [Carnobacterium sp.]
MKKSFGKKLYSLTEFYWIMYLAFFSVYDLIQVKKKGLLSPHFMERIMLAVTQVNGCRVCSYAHTKMALEVGMKSEEIKNILAGVSDDIPEEEQSAILFSQHYADSRGNPSQKTWEQVTGTYGLPKSIGILASIRVMMLGNVIGIPWSSFTNRLKGSPDERSNLLYEISMILGTFLFVPIALVHALLAKLVNQPAIKFEKMQTV